MPNDNASKPNIPELLPDALSTQFAGKDQGAMLKQQDNKPEKKKEEEDMVDIELLPDMPKVHPALDFVNNTMFIAIPWPVSVKKTEKIKNNEGVVEDKEVTRKQLAIVCITSNREWWPCTPGIFSLKKLNMAPIVAPVQRWSHNSRMDFIEGKITMQNMHTTYTRIKEPYLKYLDYRHPSTYSFLALWVIGTYFFPIFKAYPYVCFSGKEPAKTKFLPITQQVAFNAVQSSNIDSSSLYSIVEGQRATLLIDEAETLIKSQEHGEDRWMHLRQLLRNGNKPGNPVLPPEKNGEEQICTEKYDVYSPKMIASIAGSEDILESRAIYIQVSKSQDKVKRDRTVKPEDPVFQGIRDELYCLAMTRCQEVKRLYDEEAMRPIGIHAHHWEMWRPIMALARMVSNDIHEPAIYDHMVDFARFEARKKLPHNLNSYNSQLLLVLKEKVTNPIEITCTEALQWLKEYIGEESPKWLNIQWLRERFNGWDLERAGKVTKGLGRNRSLFKINPEIIANLAPCADLDDKDIGKPFKEQAEEAQAPDY